MPAALLNSLIVLFILFGTIQCFFGYRIFKVILGLTGFLVGTVLAGGIGYAIAQETAVSLLAGMVGGAIGAEVMIALYFAGIFLVGAFLGAILGAVLYGLSGGSPEPAVVVLLAVLAGVLALIFQRFMIILSTGFGGAWNVVMGIALLIAGTGRPETLEEFLTNGATPSYAIVLGWLLLGIAGVIIQYTAARKQDEKAPSAE